MPLVSDRALREPCRDLIQAEPQSGSGTPAETTDSEFVRMCVHPRGIDAQIVGDFADIHESFLLSQQNAEVVGDEFGEPLELALAEDDELLRHTRDLIVLDGAPLIGSRWYSTATVL